MEVYRSPTTFAEEVEHVAALATALKCAALMSDERLDPFSYVLLTSEGERLWVDVESSALDERGALIIEGPARHPEGRFSSALALDAGTLTRPLSQLLGADESRIRVEGWVGPAAMPALCGQPLCAHAEYLEQVANIPGGSDSEHRCIWVDGVSRREVVTKSRRAAW